MVDENSRLIILASGSPRRRELLSMLGLPFAVVSSDVDESTPPEWAPDKVVRSLALRKAEAVITASNQQNTLIIGSDTIVELDGRILGKPVDKQDSKAMLTALQGKSHQVYTGIACIGLPEDKIIVDHRVTTVTMRALSPEEIDAYVDTGEPADKAGSYAIQGLGATLVEKIDGCYFNVVGLPLSLLGNMLSEFGIQVLEGTAE